MSIRSRRRIPIMYAGNVRDEAGGGQPARLQLYARHSVLRKISTALRVRISPSMDRLGPYIVVDDVTSAEVLIVAQILEDRGGRGNSDRSLRWIT